MKEQHQHTVKAAVQARRSSLEDKAKYREIVKKMLEDEEAAVKKLLTVVLETLEINRETFENTHKKLANHP